MYTAKAYVKIPRERTQDLILELCRLDYKNSAYHPCDIFWFIEDGYFFSREYTTELEEGVFIDCNAYTPNGTEEEAVRLFMELAQMRDDVAENQWFVCVLPYYDSGLCRNIVCGEVRKMNGFGVEFGVDGNGEDEITHYYVDGVTHSEHKCSEDYIIEDAHYDKASPLEVAEAFKDGKIEL